MKKIFYTLCGCLLCCTSPLSAQTPLAPNTLHYLQQMPSKGSRITSRSVGNVPQLLDAYLAVDPEKAEIAELEQLGIRINLNLGDLLTVQIPADQLQSLSHYPWIKYVQLAATPQPMMDQARAETGVDFIHKGTELPQIFTGKDVVVGIIDAGFDYTHPNFYTADGKELRIKRVWEQSNTQGTPPEKFSYGAEYTTPESIIEANYDLTSNSHGTHVAGIAAGSYKGNQWYGVAGDADIVLVSKGELTPNNVNISDAIAYIYQYAEQVGKPCVINMSLGMEIGPHDGTSLFDQVSDRLQGAGKLLVGSVGNFHGQPIHVNRNFKSAEDQPLKTMIDFKTKPTTKNFGGEIDIWGEAGMKYDVQVVMNYFSKDEVVWSSEVMDASLTEGNSQTFELTKNGTGKVLVTTEIHPFNQKPHTLISLQVTNVRNRNAIGIIITPRSAGEVHLWADNIYVQLTDNDCEGWTAGNGDYTLAEIGGTGKRIISVGAYTTRNSYTRLGSTTTEHLDETVGDISSFSSTGPALDGRMKPEITAPGAFIISSVNSHDAGLSAIPLAGGIDGTNYCYGYMQGTSMAAPFVAGTLAIWLQANPELTPEKVREILKATAIKDDFTGALGQAGEGTWGYGKLDAYHGLKAILSSTGIKEIVTDQGVDFRYRFNQLSLLFTRSAHQVEISIHDITGKCQLQNSFNVVRSGEEIILPTHSLPKGPYLLQVKCQDQVYIFKFLK